MPKEKVTVTIEQSLGNG